MLELDVSDYKEEILSNRIKTNLGGIFIPLILSSLIPLKDPLPAKASGEIQTQNSSSYSELVTPDNTLAKKHLGSWILGTITDGESSIKSINELPKSKEVTIIPGVTVNFGTNETKPENLTDYLTSFFKSKYSPGIPNDIIIKIFSAPRSAFKGISEAVNFRVADKGKIYYIIVVNEETFTKTEEQKISALPENIREQIVNYSIKEIADILGQNLSYGKTKDMFGKYGNTIMLIQDLGLMPSFANEVRESALKDLMGLALIKNSFLEKDALDIAENIVNSFEVQEHTWVHDFIINILESQAKIILYKEGKSLTRSIIDTKIKDLIDTNPESIRALYINSRKFIREINSYQYNFTFANKETADIVAYLIQEYINRTQLNELPITVKGSVKKIQEDKNKVVYKVLIEVDNKTQ